MHGLGLKENSMGDLADDMIEAEHMGMTYEEYHDWLASYADRLTDDKPAEPVKLSVKEDTDGLRTSRR
jgi:hypothetical protein